MKIINRNLYYFHIFTYNQYNKFLIRCDRVNRVTGIRTYSAFTESIRFLCACCNDSPGAIE